MLLVKLINKAQELKSRYQTINPATAQQYLTSHKQGDFTLLDVRQDWEYEEARVPGATHIPLPELPDRWGELDPDKPTLVYCRAGGRSASAASLLKGKGFPEVYNIMGGMGAWENEAAVGPAGAGMLFFTGDETVQEIIALACRMEVNLGIFYETMAAQSKDEETAATLSKLAGFEEKHKNWLLTVYRQMSGQDLDPEMLTASLAAGETLPLEGGLTADEFMDLNAPMLDDPRAVIEAGMMFEAQALDLYMRYAGQAEDAESRALLLKLADEERAHLKALGNLLDRVHGG